jgi:hypothetical protein
VRGECHQIHTEFVRDLDDATGRGLVSLDSHMDLQPLVFQLVGDAAKEGASTLRRLHHVSRHQREDVCASHRLVRDDLPQSDASSRRVREMFYEEAAMGTWLRRLFECVLKAILGALAELVYIVFILIVGGILALIAEIINLIKKALNQLPFVNLETKPGGSYLGSVWDSFSGLSSSIWTFIKSCW